MHKSTEARCAKASRPRPGAQPASASSGAATGEFARYGLGGARVDRIAARAGANKRMLYYYFGNKEALFLAVLEARYAHIRQRRAAGCTSATSTRPRACGGWSRSPGTTT